jgi:hypothetical protein
MIMTGRKHKTPEQTRGTLAFANRFSRYAPMEEKTVRDVQVTENEVVPQLKNLFRQTKYDENYDRYDRFYRETFHKQIARLVKGIDYSAKDVELFSLVLEELKKDFKDICAVTCFGLPWGLESSTKVGLFLSALINQGKDRDYIIHTENLSFAIFHLGFKNTKNITVVGPVGDGLGCQMNSGTIVVTGHAADDVGEHMDGGTIRVKGNTGDYIGGDMRDGKIYLSGDYGTIEEDAHGRIYHKGKLIFDNGLL